MNLLLMISLFLLALHVVPSITTTLIPCKSLTEEDKKRFLGLFESSLSSQQPDALTWHHSVVGYQLIRPGAFPKAEQACQLFGRTLTASSESAAAQVKTIFHALEAASVLQSTDCSKAAGGAWPTQEKLAAITKQLTAAIQSGEAGSSAETLYYTVAALTALKAKVETSTVHGLIQKLLKKDSTAASQGFIFHTVVLLDLDKKALKAHFDDIEDVIQQADETDDTYLFYDSGLFTTAFMVDAIYKLAEKYSEVPKIPEDKMLKLSNYLLSRRYASDPRGAAYLLLALRTLAENKRIVPACITYHGAAQVTASSKSQPLRFIVSTVWGQAIDTSLKAISVTDVKSKTVQTKAPLDLKRDSKTSIYELSLVSLPLTRGQYTLVFGGPSATGGNAVHYVGLTGASLVFKVTAEKVQVGPVKLSVGEAEGNVESDASLSHASTHVLEAEGQSLSSPLTLDTHLKLRITIPVTDSSERTPQGDAFRPQQCFLRLYHDQTGREIILVATPSSKSSGQAGGSVLQLILDPSTQAKDFGYLSGVYTMELLVGDALMPQGVRWTLGKASITLPAAPVAPPSAPSPNVHWADAPRLPGQVAKSEIHHQFRPADKRAPAPLSTLFTVLCILPLGLLLILWGKLGINLRGLSETSPAAIGFHICLAGMFVLYYVYWTRWNMFQTLGYVALLGVPTFLCGNIMLRSVATQRLQEKKASGDAM